jgi:arginine utilization regulatory protein
MAHAANGSPGASDRLRLDIAQARLEDYLRRRAHWAGRMRALLAEEEALHSLERSLIGDLAPVDRIAAGSPETKGRPLPDVVQAYERRLIEQALAACAGVQRAAALLLGLSPSTLNEKLKRLGLRPGAPRG